MMAKTAVEGGFRAEFELVEDDDEHIETEHRIINKSPEESYHTLREGISGLDKPILEAVP